ncbi:type II toxin-antitoxin system RelE/ParE family toxin [Paraburkholderia nemoris]|uniref:type II toxin-antitoxin system RelE/ParE family toxin n=1 Tax=Paraburkholderia nemoris TaxID=2793076 RepID=UPI001B8BA388|nr:type II toxin-antitoxin system RelE/ParE family toxin [Paraburkholderia nemoris]
MRVEAVIKDAWSIYEVLNARGDPALADIDDESDCDRCLAFLEHVAKNGPEAFAENRTHHVCDDPTIWQFDVTGTLRLLYFYEEGRMIVLAKMFYKAGGKSGKTPPATIKAAKKVYGEYQKAKKAGTLELVEIDGEEDED